MCVNRGVSFALVVGFIGLLHSVEPSPEARDRWLYLVALPMGYGHLAGALVSARGRLGLLLVRRPVCLHWLLAASSILTLFASYGWVLQHGTLGPLVVAGLLGISAWHIVENDLALGDAYRNGLAMRRGGNEARRRLEVSGGVGLLVMAALFTPEGGRYAVELSGFDPLPPLLSVVDLATAVLLYHAVSWVFFFCDRARRSGGPGRHRILASLALLHAAPFVLNGACYLWAESVFSFLSMPTVYLFWSTLHAFQTSAVRRLRSQRSSS